MREYVRSKACDVSALWCHSTACQSELVEKTVFVGEKFLSLPFMRQAFFSVIMKQEAA